MNDQVSKLNINDQIEYKLVTYAMFLFFISVINMKWCEVLK